MALSYWCFLLLQILEQIAPLIPTAGTLRMLVHNVAIAVGNLSTAQSVTDLATQINGMNATLVEVRTILEPLARNKYLLTEKQMVRYECQWAVCRMFVTKPVTETALTPWPHYADPEARQVLRGGLVPRPNC